MLFNFLELKLHFAWSFFIFFPIIWYINLCWLFYSLIHYSFRIIYRSLSNRPSTSVLSFAEKYNLGDPEFGNIYQAEYDAYSDILLKQLQEEIWTNVKTCNSPEYT